jgi:hypothetical protein
MGSFSLLHWIIVAGIVFLIYKAARGTVGVKGKISDTGPMICPNCGTRGEPKTLTPGTVGMELILWICFLVPGLIYSIWRISNRKSGCPSCGQPGMIDVTTPNGKLLLNKFAVTPAKI